MRWLQAHFWVNHCEKSFALSCSIKVESNIFCMLEKPSLSYSRNQMCSALTECAHQQKPLWAHQWWCWRSNIVKELLLLSDEWYHLEDVILHGFDKHIVFWRQKRVLRLWHGMSMDLLFLVTTGSLEGQLRFNSSELQYFCIIVARSVPFLFLSTSHENN